MIAAIALLLTCQLAGEVIHRLTGAPLPGPVLEGAFAGIGMAMNALLTAVMLSAAAGLFWSRSARPSHDRGTSSPPRA